MATFESSLKSRLIYVFAINDEWHKDCLKVGETTLDEDNGDFPAPNSDVLNKAARKRIDQYTKTAGIAYNLLSSIAELCLAKLVIRDVLYDLCRYTEFIVRIAFKSSSIRIDLF